jgi:hypothetical protein
MKIIIYDSTTVLSKNVRMCPSISYFLDTLQKACQRQPTELLPLYALQKKINQCARSGQINQVHSSIGGQFDP